ncbi:putative ribosomal protein S19/S15 [Helianthus annuus]|nr:putative ribosomal protein S19/S15 [Helianthus annuus]
MINKLNESGEKHVIKSWSRASMIIPEMVGHRIAIHMERNIARFRLKMLW